MTQVTFHRACELWKNDKKRYVKKSTMAAYSLIIHNHLEPRFGLLKEVNRQSVQKMVDDELAAGVSQQTIRGWIIVLKMILRFCEARGYIRHRIMEIRFPTQRVRRQAPVLSVEEERRMMEWLSRHRDTYSLGLRICLLTGIRIGEICALTWKDVDLEAGVIRIRRTVHRVYLFDSGAKHTELTVDFPKTANSYRDIPIIKELSDILYEYSQKADPDSFVVSGRLRPAEPQTMRNHLKKVAESLNLSMRRFHGLRHTFATRCVESKCDYKTLSTILGHSNVGTTMNLYVHPGIEQKRKCVEEMVRSIL